MSLTGTCSETRRFLKAPRIRSTDYIVLDLMEFKLPRGTTETYFRAEVMRGRIFNVGNYAFRPCPHNFKNLRILPTAGIQKAEFATSGAWPSQGATAFIQSIPENWRDESDRYNYQKRRLAVTDYTMMKLRVWPQEQLAFANSETKAVWDETLSQMKSREDSATVQANFKLHGAQPINIGSMLKNHLETEKYPLSDYQRTAVALSLGRSYALFMEPGTGKTAIAQGRINVEAAEYYRKHKLAMSVLIVCPKQCRLNWQNEFEKFSTLQGTTSIIEGTAKKRMEKICKSMSFRKNSGQAYAACITSYGTFKNDVDNYAFFPWDLIIYDESHAFKDPRTKVCKSVRRFQALMNSHTAYPEGEFFKTLTLTGTPVTNGPDPDLFSQLEALQKNGSGFATYKGFRDFHTIYETVGQAATGGAFQKLLGYANIEFLRRFLSGWSFRVTKKEAALGLPDKLHDIHEVEMTAKQTEAYERLASQYYVEIERIVDGKTTLSSLEANSILVKLLRLTTITSGHVKFDDMDLPVQIEETNQKVDALMNLLGANSGSSEDGSDCDQKTEAEKTIIWAVWKEDFRIIKEALDFHNNNPARKGPEIGYVEYWGDVPEKKKADAIERFNNDPSIKVFLGSPKSAGSGLNLLGYNPENPADIGVKSYGVSENGVEEINHSYVSHMIFFSQSWSMVERAQAEDRAHRRGTKMPLRVTDLVATTPKFDTIDKTLRKRVEEKILHAEEIQDLTDVLKLVHNLKTK